MFNLRKPVATHYGLNCAPQKDVFKAYLWNPRSGPTCGTVDVTLHGNRVFAEAIKARAP